MPLSTAFLYDDDIGVTPEGAEVAVGFGVVAGFGIAECTGLWVGDRVGFNVGNGAIVGWGVFVAEGVMIAWGVKLAVGGVRVGILVGVADSVSRVPCVCNFEADVITVMSVSEGIGGW